MGQIAVSGIESAHPSISPPRAHAETDGDWMMKRIVGLISVALVLSACTQKSAYEAAVEDMEPVYCYKSLAGVQCYQEPTLATSGGW